jgi:hypothetical protein
MRRATLQLILVLAVLMTVSPPRALAQEQVVTWSPAQAWAGSTDAATEPFFVTAAAWRIRWRLEALPGFVPNLAVWVRQDGQLVQGSLISHKGSGEGTVDVDLGPGAYSLDIASTNGDWTLTVEEFARIAGPDDRASRLAERIPVRRQLQADGNITTQACVGDPALPGQGTVAGAVGFGDDAISYGGEIGYNPSAPVGFGFSAAFIDFEDTDTNAFGVGGSVSLEAMTAPVSVCPATGLGYVRIEDVDINLFTIPIGVGLGGAIETTGSLRIIPFVVPQFLVLHARGFGDSETETEFGVSFGVTFAGRSGFGSFDVGITTIDDSDPVFGVSAGFIF